MAENISETRPPEPLPKPPEVPKPTERPSGSEASDGRVPESPQSAQQDARDAARSEHAKAAGSRAQDGLRPEPEVQTQPDAHTATEGPHPTPDVQTPLDKHTTAKNGPEGLERLNAHAAARTGRDASGPQDATAGEQAEEHAAARQSAAAERAKATGDLAPVGDGSGPWYDEGTNHREGGAVQQLTEGSCVSASGEMLTDGRITQPELLSELGEWSNLSALREELNNRDGDGTWTGHYFEDGNQALRRASEGPMAAQVQAPFGRAHMVILEPGENESFTVRDPYEGSSYDVDSSWVEKYVAGGVFR